MKRCETCKFWHQYSTVKHGHCRHPQAHPAHRTQGTWKHSRCEKWEAEIVDIPDKPFIFINPELFKGENPYLSFPEYFQHKDTDND